MAVTSPTRYEARSIVDGKSPFLWRDESFYVRCDALEAFLKAAAEVRPCDCVPQFPVLPPLQGPWQLPAALSALSLPPGQLGSSSSSLSAPRSRQSHTYLLCVDSAIAIAETARQGVGDDCRARHTLALSWPIAESRRRSRRGEASGYTPSHR